MLAGLLFIDDPRIFQALAWLSHPAVASVTALHQIELS